MHCVVVNYRTPRDLESFLNSWLQFAPSNATLSVVNVDPLEEDRQVSYRWYPVMVDQGCHVDWLNTKTNVGYGSACCLGVEGRDSEVYGFFNADTKLTSGVLEEMEQALLSNDDWGLIGPRQVDSRGRITHGGILGTNTAPYQRGWQELDRGQYTEVIEDAVSVMGSAFLVKKACWDELHNCRTFREVHPDAPGAFLPTFLYYEETFCVPQGSWIWTADGPQRIEEVQPGTKVWSFSETKGHIQMAEVSANHEIGVKKCLTLRGRGRSVTLSDDHEVPVIKAGNRNLLSGTLVWKKAKDVVVGDYLLKASDVIEEDGSSSIPDGVTVEAMQFFGLFLGDGCIDRSNERSIHISLPNSDRNRCFYEDLAKRVFVKQVAWTRRGTPRVEPETAPVEIHSQTRAFRFTTVHGVRWLRSLGFTGRAWEKRIPSWVFKTPREYRLALLAGLVDSDGCISSRGSLTFTLTSEGLVEDIRQLAASCGLPVGDLVLKPGGHTVTFPQGYTSTARDAWTVYISDPSDIPFADPLYRSYLKDRRQRDGKTLIKAVGLDPNTMGAMRVTHIEDAGELPVYDLTVPETNTFVVSGVPVHNCAYHARAHGWKAVYYGPCTMIHQWHESIKNAPREREFFRESQKIFRETCKHHNIEHD